MILLAIDPGETVGWSIWDTEKYVKLTGGQTPRVAFTDALADRLNVGCDLAHHEPPTETVLGHDIDEIVCEEWMIYPEHARRGALDRDKCLTARTIGAIQLLARMAGIPVHFQNASIKEQAKAMGAENHFVEPRTANRHENDSTYHSIYYMVRHCS